LARFIAEALKPPSRVGNHAEKESDHASARASTRILHSPQRVSEPEFTERSMTIEINNELLLFFWV
jgi:hypothetical protein